jgi:DNA-binding NarL/FixJ family response regulator
MTSAHTRVGDLASRARDRLDSVLESVMSPSLRQDPAPPVLRLLVAADRLVIREGMKRLLAAPGLKVVGEAATRDEVLQRVRSAAPDVLVLDLFVGGSKTLALIREVTSRHPACRVLVFGVRAEHPDVLRLLETGAAAYLTGDLSRHELLDAVRHLARGATYISPSLASTLISRGSGPPHEVLSDREYDVLCLSGLGVSFQQIASELRLSPKTVHTYRTRILAKLGLPNSAAMIRYAVEHGLVPPSPTVSRERRKKPTPRSTRL